MAQTTTADVRDRRPSGAAIALLVGAVLICAGVFLNFIEIEADFGEAGQAFIEEEELKDQGGWDTDDGKFYFGIGVAIIVFAIIASLARSSTARRVFGILALLLSAFSLYAAIVDVSDVQDAVPDELQQGLDALGFTFDVSTGLGLWIVLVGSVLATLAALVVVFSRPRDVTTTTTTGAPPPPPPPAATTTTETRETPPST